MGRLYLDYSGGSSVIIRGLQRAGRRIRELKTDVLVDTEVGDVL